MKPPERVPSDGRGKRAGTVPVPEQEQEVGPPRDLAASVHFAQADLDSALVGGRFGGDPQRKSIAWKSASRLAHIVRNGSNTCL